MSTTPHPSPLTMPFADASNGLHRLSQDVIPMVSQTPFCDSGIRKSETPPTSAMLHAPSRMEAQAVCNATREDEQAVLIIMLGPFKLSQ